MNKFDPINWAKKNKITPAFMNYGVGVTFLYFSDGQLIAEHGSYSHRELENNNPSLKEKLNNFSWDEVLEGRTVELPSGHMACSFWPKEPFSYKNYLTPCLKKLISYGYLTDQDIVVLPPYKEPHYVSEVLKGIEIKDLSSLEKQEVDYFKKLHLMKGDEKKQALTSLGIKPKTPASAQYGLAPGQKAWALNSENFSFKKWLLQITERSV
ncbi:MAG: hypothetical protein DWQ19_10210 [Crenarchaeota archaeon]|nr:MAG: hypothetical protein DWQ19_10210 [Thermoproteota archaeon]